MSREELQQLVSLTITCKDGNVIVPIITWNKINQYIYELEKQLEEA